MTVTPTQIKAVLDAALVAAGQTLRTYDYAITEKRRIMPYIMITIPTKSEDKNVRTVTYSQRFKITLFVRQRGMSESEVQFQDTIEPIILAALDGTVLAGDRLFTETKNWTRPDKIVPNPIPHYESTLDVFVTDIESETGAGQVVARISVDLPGLSGLPLLSEPVGPNNMKTEDVFSTDKRRVYVAPVGHARAYVFEIESTEARRTAIDTIIRAKAPISVTIHRASLTDTFTCMVTEMSQGAGFRDVESLIIRLEVFDS